MATINISKYNQTTSDNDSIFKSFKDSCILQNEFFKSQYKSTNPKDRPQTMNKNRIYLKTVI